MAFHPHLPAKGYSIVAKTLGASMWFWVFYKAKQEGPVVLGLQHPWDGHGHGHGHGHGSEGGH
ncbi:hypothetical protein DFQ27_003762 [Actinomortierella ambigua]|uniref:Uncharacterized protein n=1 Tax=Actinomortierella ambigua TaxID=1343610 RepID=A0A9P6U4B6_9FUNG|nr:hypothetical protein DFQ26_006981 [Actinomortierella ambigua]KAG0260036.1 hypothetical protein DFQ27_003762 [Actinomortierella ambigua]